MIPFLTEIAEFATAALVLAAAVPVLKKIHASPYKVNITPKRETSAYRCDKGGL